MIRWKPNEFLLHHLAHARTMHRCQNDEMKTTFEDMFLCKLGKNTQNLWLTLLIPIMCRQGKACLHVFFLEKSFVPACMYQSTFYVHYIKKKWDKLNYPKIILKFRSILWTGPSLKLIFIWSVLVDLQAVVAIFPRKVPGGRIVSILVETVTTLGRCSSKNLELRWEGDKPTRS